MNSVEKKDLSLISKTQPELDAGRPQSWLARNRDLLVQDPRLLFQKLSTWLKPMRSDYHCRWNRGLRRWMIRYHTDILFNKVSWMGLTARKIELDCWVYQQIILVAAGVQSCSSS